jgi:hypothetical protein
VRRCDLLRGGCGSCVGVCGGCVRRVCGEVCGEGVCGGCVRRVYAEVKPCATAECNDRRVGVVLLGRAASFGAAADKSKSRARWPSAVAWRRPRDNTHTHTHTHTYTHKQRPHKHAHTHTPFLAAPCTLRQKPCEAAEWSGVPPPSLVASISQPRWARSQPTA